MSEIVAASDLHKRFGDFVALRGVDLHLDRGEVVGFLGANGAGKSTTMKILTGYLAPTSGSAHIAGHDLRDDPLACRKMIGYLPEELPLYLDMKVESYLDHVARLKGVARHDRRREVVEAMGQAAIEHNAKRYIKKLSKGNRQRVGLAQALVGKPPLLILDEPTSGLDPAQVANFRDLIRDLAQRHTILLSTHILGEVEACCSRAVVIHGGRNILNETIDHLHQSTDGIDRVRIRLRHPDRLDECTSALKQAPFIDQVARDGDTLMVDAKDDGRGALVELVESHGGLRELSEERRSLEELFRDLIRDAESADEVGGRPAA